MAMPPRPYWKGHIRLSLVSFPVALYPAISTAGQIRFNQINKATGSRIQERRIDASTGEEVEKDDIVKGFEYEKGRYVIVDDDDLDRVRIETKKTVELGEFVEAAEIDPLYFDKPYYVVPDGPMAEDAFIVVREAMQAAGKAALGRVVLSGRERLVALMVKEKGFVLYTLHSADLVRNTRSYFDDIPDAAGNEDEVAVAETLIRRKLAAFDPSKFVDRYQEGLRQIIDEKLAGEAPHLAEQPAQARNVVNLMDALKRSLGESPDDAPAPPAKSKSTSRKAKDAKTEEPKGKKKRA